ncbi:MAG: transposase [Candidatus Eisenbacteria sp.]|nr:transposase [Candidatus Eisenbacteria bacterium]
MGYIHRATGIKQRQLPAHKVMPRVQRVASLLKRWLAGTYHGGDQDSHLEYYLDEFTFRFNRRTSRARGMLFYRLVQQTVGTDPAPYRSLVSTAPAANHNR